MVCEKNTHAMTLSMVNEKNTHAMTLVDPYVICGNNTHAMTLVVVHEKNTCNDTGESICGFWKEQTCNDSSCGS